MMGALRKLWRPRSEYEVTQTDPAIHLVPALPRNAALTAEQLRYLSFADIAEVLGVPPFGFRVSPGMEDHLYITVALDEAAEAWGER